MNKQLVLRDWGGSAVQSVLITGRKCSVLLAGLLVSETVLASSPALEGWGSTRHY